MVCKHVDKGRSKCGFYYPEEKEKALDLGDFTVILNESTELADDFYQRSFLLTNKQTSETRTVTQYHYSDWPDHEAPDESAM